MIREVFQMALDHQNSGHIEQAEQLYLEILNIQPDNPAANHNLGVIEVRTKGAVFALPRLELAVQTQPDSEQFWVSYIDALMQTGAIDTVADALELGQKFGLRKETAQILAGEFVRDFDYKKEGLRVSILDALQTTLKPSNKHPELNTLHKENSTPVFYIWAPNYTECSSGIKALHLLCHRLNTLGHEAYITSNVVNSELETPKLNSDIKHKHQLESRLQIAIYPEVQVGNPLLVPNVVRYLLNKPNYFLKTSWFGKFHQDEQVIHYDDIFSIPWIQSECVRIQTIDRDIFKPPASQDDKRSGFLVYSHRVAPDLSLIPEWCKPFQVISMENPKSAKELASLYQESSGMIVFERTAAIVEAIFCGCPVIASSAYGFKDFKIYEDSIKLAWDFDRAAYEQAKDSIDLFPAVYEENEIADTHVLQVAINKIIAHFQSDELEILESTPAHAFNLANQYLQQGVIVNAVMAYRQVIIDHPSSVEAYYRLSEILVKIGLIEQGLEMLIQGELYLQQLPEHQILHAIRAMYYKKLSEVYTALGQISKSDFYFDKSRVYENIPSIKINSDLEALAEANYE